MLATYGYDDLGRRTSLTRGDGSVMSYGYDAASRLTSLADDLAGTSYDQTLGFSYNPASQIVTNTRSNDAYAWTGHYNLNRGYTANGLNQYTASGAVTPTYDTKGNLTSAGSTTYSYTSENKLATAGSNLLAYEPLGRLQYYPQGGLAFMYEGDHILAELNLSNLSQIARRYVFGANVDEPLVWYEGSGTSDRRFLHQDERGSVVAVTNGAGTLLNVNTYDECGIPRSTNAGRFQYTGQAWLAELGMYYYKARIYSPTLGRFLQTDPSGMNGGMNLYRYASGDPVNFGDPSGLCPQGSHQEVPTGSHIARCFIDTDSDESGSSGSSGSSSGTDGASPGQFHGGGPLDGASSCPDCITSASDPRYAGSVAANGGQYINQVWVANGPGLTSMAGLHVTGINVFGGDGSEPFFLKNGRYIRDPNWQKSEYSDTVDVATGIVVAGPLLVMGGAEAAATEYGGITVGDAMFARGIGLTNSNNFIRLGWGWEGSAMNGNTVFRMAIGNRNWYTVPLLPAFPWHF